MHVPFSPASIELNSKTLLQQSEDHQIQVHIMPGFRALPSLSASYSINIVGMVNYMSTHVNIFLFCSFSFGHLLT